jgi:hypothetical protein
MKRVALAITLLGVIAGTASAAIFVPPPAPEANRPRPPKVAQAVEVVKAAKLEPMPSLEHAKPPVPMANLPKRKPIPQAAAPADRQQQAAATPSAPDLSDPSAAKAKASVELDGYKGVRLVAQLPDGRWKARAMRGRTEIGVTVEPDGSVRAD